ncbi:MAG: hypothetical protein ACE37H_17915 [Phycisphaeraceae bacterium]
MNPEEMKDVMQAEPFKPFVIHYPSGRGFEISSSDQAVLSADKRTLVRARSGQDGGIDLIDVIMAERIEILPEQPKPRMWWINKNGH